MLSQFMYALKQSHFSAVLKVLKYLKGDHFRGIGFFETVSYVYVHFLIPIGPRVPSLLQFLQYLGTVY